MTCLKEVGGREIQSYLRHHKTVNYLAINLPRWIQDPHKENDELVQRD